MAALAALLHIIYDIEYITVVCKNLQKDLLCNNTCTKCGVATSQPFLSLSFNHSLQQHYDCRCRCGVCPSNLNKRRWNDSTHGRRIDGKFTVIDMYIMATSTFIIDRTFSNQFDIILPQHIENWLKWMEIAGWRRQQPSYLLPSKQHNAK